MDTDPRAEVCVFLGPSLPLAEARALLPGARFLPPARGGDVYRAHRRHQPRMIAIIDGLFEQTAAIYHKEILYVLSQGVWVYGSSSMGALRASECAAFGMIGVGDVYRRFASGEYIDDDEVAVSHAAAEQGHRPLSEAMVTLRFGFARAQERGVLSAAEAEALRDAIKQRHYAERSWPAVFALARERGLPEARVTALREFIETHRLDHDQKRADAVELLRALADRLTGPELPAFEPDFDFVASNPWQAIKSRIDHELRGVRVGEDWVPFERIKNHVLLFRDDYEVQQRLSQALTYFAEGTRCFTRPPDADRLYWALEGQEPPGVDPELGDRLSAQARRDAVALVAQLEIEHAIHEVPTARPVDMIPLQLALREELDEIAEEVALKWRAYAAAIQAGGRFDDEALLAEFAAELDSPTTEADILAAAFHVDNGATLLEELRARAAARREI